MGLARSFQEALRKQLGMHAAWLPVANDFALGTYGVVEGGVLRPMGHITRDFRVSFESSEGPPVTGVNFASKGVKLVRFSSGAEVEALPEVGDLDAKLSFRFEKENSCVVRAPRLDFSRMDSIQAVGRQVARAPGWDRKYRVVSGVYRAADCVALLASEAGTTLEFTGKVSALKAVEGGSVNAEFGFSSSNESSLNLSGSGVIGLRLFKIGWFDRIRLLADQEEVEVEEESSDSELEDTI